MKLNGLDYTVVGVAPRGFFGTELLLAPEFWVPMAMEPQIEPGNNWLDNAGAQNIWIAGRLKPGIAWQQAEADLNFHRPRFGASQANVLSRVLRRTLLSLCARLAVMGSIGLSACYVPARRALRIEAAVALREE